MVCACTVIIVVVAISEQPYEVDFVFVITVAALLVQTFCVDFDCTADPPAPCMFVCLSFPLPASQRNVFFRCVLASFVVHP